MACPVVLLGPVQGPPKLHSTSSHPPGQSGGVLRGAVGQSPEEGPFQASDECEGRFRGMIKGKRGLAVGSVSSGRLSCPGSPPSAEGFPHLLAPAPLPLLILGCMEWGRVWTLERLALGRRKRKASFMMPQASRQDIWRPCRRALGAGGVGYGSSAVQGTGSQPVLGGPP